jgi:hypothetical protein
VMTDYEGFLTRQGRENEAMALLLKELKEAPAESESAESTARLIAYHHPKQIAPDEETYWRWLAARPKWEISEERLLWELLQRVERTKLDPYLTRAEALAAEAHPSRNSALGWVMNRMGLPARSIPLLRDALARADENELRKRTGFTLFESCLDFKDWKQAEEAFPDAAQQLTGREIPEWLGRSAVLAARAGAKDDALRIWKSAANVNPCCFGPLDDLAKAGLARELREFYRKFGAQLPTSRVPALAMKILEDSRKP